MPILNDRLADFIRHMPKVELHLHIEGTLEPELMFALAKRNAIALPFATVDDVRAAYEFTDLQSFLDIYYAGARVLIEEQDFYDLTWAYLARVNDERVRHVEIFFDPQTHTDRGVAFETVVTGIRRALDEAERRFGMTSRLIMCFLRHLSADAALETLEHATWFKHWIFGVGLDSSEVGHPPEKFAPVFDRARDLGYALVAHAGEEGPPEYIWQALDVLRVARVDHGVRSVEDPGLVDRLRADAIPLTVCPLSNVKLRVFSSMKDHTLKRMLDMGLRVTINSDDPAYFGGYITDNFLAAQRALALNRDDLYLLAENAIDAAFVEEHRRTVLREELKAVAAAS